jgi:hypothetical protein
MGWILFEVAVWLGVMFAYIFYEVPAEGLSGPVSALLIAWLVTWLLKKLNGLRPSRRRYNRPTMDSTGSIHWANESAEAYPADGILHLAEPVAPYRKSLPPLRSRRWPVGRDAL